MSDVDDTDNIDKSGKMHKMSKKPNLYPSIFNNRITDGFLKTKELNLDMNYDQE